MLIKVVKKETLIFIKEMMVQADTVDEAKKIVKQKSSLEWTTTENYSEGEAQYEFYRMERIDEGVLPNAKD